MTSEFKKQGPAQTKCPNIDKKLIKNEIQFTDCL